MGSDYAKWNEFAKGFDDDGNPILDIDPKDIGVTFGKPMTEAEFAAHRQASGLPVHVISANGPRDPKDAKDDAKAKLREKLKAMADGRK